MKGKIGKWCVTYPAYKENGFILNAETRQELLLPYASSRCRSTILSGGEMRTKHVRHALEMADASWSCSTVKPNRHLEVYMLTSSMLATQFVFYANVIILLTKEKYILCRL